MTLLLLLEMVVSVLGARRAVGSLSYQQLYDRAGVGATLLRDRGVGHLAYLAPNDAGLPVALFAASWAGIPLVPLNYRESPERIRSLLAEHDDVLVLVEEEARGLDLGAATMTLAEWDAATATSRAGAVAPSTTDGDDVAALLYTSGTTAAPKAVVLRHRHLASYVVGSVELATAEEDEASLVSVPPYHVAGLATIVSNAYAGRRIVYLPTFSPAAWCETVTTEKVTHAMVVPTMLARIADHLADDLAGGGTAPPLRSLAYGGARLPVAVLERALALFPDTDFVNAYGLTETSSTIAVLGPEDHRRRRGLASVGRVVPGVEVDVRDGEIWVRGEQVSGEYLGTTSGLDPDGWFPTRDRGYVDADGFLYVEGRSDDTIIRGGENVAPAEIEDVLLQHPLVREAAVVGLPDEEWGQRIGAAVVLVAGAQLDAEALRAWARTTLRTAKTPDVIVLRDALPYTETGKLLRREVLADLGARPGP